MLFHRDLTAGIALGLAREEGIFVGTISWKFSGWCGLVYDEERYLWQNHFSQARFERECLREYVGVFPTVEDDATYYRHHETRFFTSLADQVPEGFRFSFKAPDDITIRTFPDLEAFGRRRGQPNAWFLNPGVFEMGFLRRLAAIRDKVGVVIFEFSHFGPDDFAHGRDFVAELDRFFESVPKDGWQYAVEVRNANLLQPEYFETLHRHGVAHVYNQWTRMPSVNEQLALCPAERNPFIVGRFLLTPGRSHDRAEEAFTPYHQVREVDPGAREALRVLIEAARRRDPPPANEDGKKPAADGTGRAEPRAFLYVGNHLEGNAPHTLGDVLAGLDRRASD